MVVRLSGTGRAPRMPAEVELLYVVKAGVAQDDKATSIPYVGLRCSFNADRTVSHASKVACNYFIQNVHMLQIL